MALVKCTECGKEISDTAVSCPNCGCKTAHSQKITEANIIGYKFFIGTAMCIALVIIGIILFFPGMIKLHEKGYNLFFGNWAVSCYRSVVEAGIKSTTGLVSIIIGVVGEILLKKYIDRVNANSNFSSQDDRLAHIYKNTPSAPVSKKRCPHCGEVVTSTVCGMCGNHIESAPDKLPTRKRPQQEQVDDGCWICPSCGRKNLSTRTDCWNCNHHV